MKYTNLNAPTSKTYKKTYFKKYIDDINQEAHKPNYQPWNYSFVQKVAQLNHNNAIFLAWTIEAVKSLYLGHAGDEFLFGKVGNTTFITEDGKVSSSLPSSTIISKIQISGDKGFAILNAPKNVLAGAKELILLQSDTPHGDMFLIIFQDDSRLIAYGKAGTEFIESICFI